MPRYRPDIDGDLETEIEQHMNGTGVSIEITADRYGISYTLARQIKYGTRVKPAKYPPPKEAPPPDVEICSCCNERPKKPGNRFLCTQCEREA
jgi:hypothetical protein